MVDFNNETTISTPAVDIVRVLILQKRENVMEAIEDYRKKTSLGYAESTNIIQARLNTFFLENEQLLTNRLTKEEFKEVVDNLESKDLKTLEKIFRLMNKALYDIRLTKIDTKKEYDQTDIELDNRENGL